MCFVRSQASRVQADAEEMWPKDTIWIKKGTDIRDRQNLHEMDSMEIIPQAFAAKINMFFTRRVGLQMKGIYRTQDYYSV